MHNEHGSSKKPPASDQKKNRPPVDPDKGLSDGSDGIIQQTDEIGNPEDRPAEADEYAESYSHPRQPQGNDARVDQREKGRGNQFGKAGEYGQRHEESDTRQPDPDKQPGHG